MNMTERLDKIVESVNQQGYVTVTELSQMFQVSPVTIRRDLQSLDDQNRILRTRGGVLPIQHTLPTAVIPTQTSDPTSPGTFIDKVDVLITSSLGPYVDSIIMDRARKNNLPVIAESTEITGAQTTILVDDEAGGHALGRAIGHYAQEHFDGKAIVLDLTYHLKNCHWRSKGFAAGIREILPDTQTILSINAQSRVETAYQVTYDAFQVHANINIIFAINDAIAEGAILACKDLGLDPDAVLVVPFGLEGNTMRQLLHDGEYCRVALAHFPEIVSLACIKAAVNVYQGRSIPHQIVTPFAVLTSTTLFNFYSQVENDWHINWREVEERLDCPLKLDLAPQVGVTNLPQRIGLAVPHIEHEWYRNLIALIEQHAVDLSIEVMVIDAEQHLMDEVALRKRRIAEVAAEQVETNDVVLLDDGQISIYLAEELAKKSDVTIVTHSIAIFDILKWNPAINLMLIGGLFDRENNTFSGSTVRTALEELLTDKLFLTVSGITLDLTLLSKLVDVDIKQAMLRSAQEVIVLADHTKFRQETGAQFGTFESVHKLITDNALPATVRLTLLEREIAVIISD